MDRRRCIRDVRLAEQGCATSGQPEQYRQVKGAYAKCKAHAGPEMRACKDKPFGPEL